jgi:hypothetical protein
MISLVQLAESYGFQSAARAGHDETRFVIVGEIYLGFVEAIHELHRSPDDVALRRGFEIDLAQCRQWVVEADASPEVSRTVVVGEITVRPIMREAGDVVETVGDDSWPPAPHGYAQPISEAERAIMDHDADLRSWPTTEERDG